MRKIYGILIVLMLMISISSIVLADDHGNHYGRDDDLDDEEDDDDQNETDYDENETDDPDENETEDDLDNETEDDIKIMNNTLGAEIRLLQLEKAITKNILIGEMSIEVLKGLEINTTDLELIIVELKILLDEVEAANASANDSVFIFVELKSEAKNLTREFREKIRELLTDEKIREIKEMIQAMVNESLQNHSNLIKIRIRQFNCNQIYRLYGIIGEANNSFVNDYIDGNITLGQVKLQLCKIINQMTKEKKYDIFSEIKEDNIRKKIDAKDSYEHKGGHNNGKGKGGPK